MPRIPIPPASAALRAFSVLEDVVLSGAPISLAELMTASGLPKPTVFRLVSLLEHAGMVAREPDGKRYTVGPHLSALALDIMMNSPMRGARHAILQRLVEEIGETCNLTMLDGNEVVYLDRVETAWPLRLHLQPRSRVPLHCTASGKLLLSQLPDPQRRELVDAIRLNAHTDNTITDPRALALELEHIRANEFATDAEEFLAGMICVAVPIRTADGRTCAAVALHAPVARMALERAIRHLPALRLAAAALSATYREAHESDRNILTAKSAKKTASGKNLRRATRPRAPGSGKCHARRV